MRRRHSHRPSQFRSNSYLQRLRPLIGLLIVIVLVYIIGSWFIGLFGYGQSHNTAVALAPELRGIVRVSIEGDEWKRAEQAIKLYPEDRVTTGANGNATLTFFDGTYVRLEENTTINIVESEQNEDESQIIIQIENGGIWVAIPTMRAFSGAITRLVTTGMFSASLPTKTEALITERSISVFDGDSIGSLVRIAGAKQNVVVGEGQTFTLPEGPIREGDDLYDLRKALDPRAIASPFLENSRKQFASHWKNDQLADTDDETDIPVNNGGTLSITQPTDKLTVQTASIEVKGTVNTELVSEVKVNGYAATIGETGAFSLEIALPDKDEATITIVATDKDNLVLAEATRVVLRDREPPEPPKFLTPAKNGETYQTQSTRFEITGEAPEDAIGIIINDYRLQFFKPGDKTWKYLASTDLENIKEGENIFTAVAINPGGYKSEPVTMTIVLGGETEGVIARSETTGDADDAAEEEDLIEPESLPDNDPLMPGTISVTAPTSGARHEAVGLDEIEFLIEGSVPSNASSVWVNGYQLRLYSGKGYWNYIASTKLNTMKRGTNKYEVVARNSDGQILDRFTYIIEFDPRG